MKLKIFMKRLLSCSCLFFFLFIFGTVEASTVFLESCETLSFDQNVRTDCQFLRGKVRFRHGNLLLYCDTAFFYEKKNSIDAYGNVKIVQADSLTIYGSHLFYNGNTEVAQMRKNVRMVNRKMTLTTNFLDYDKKNNVVHYYNSGKMVDKGDVLTSIEGNYYPKTKISTFQKRVVLTNEKFTLKTDSLIYNSSTSYAQIVGPSTIISDSTTIYAESGWYNTKKETGKLTKKSYIKQPRGKKIVGDTIYYDKARGIAEAFSHVLLTDSVQQISVGGNYGKFNKKREKGFITRHATFYEHSSKDTLFLTADTIFYRTDSTISHINACHNVQFWQKDFQGLCDSLAYNTKDSILNMYNSPIIWSDKNQITGKTIQVFSKNRGVEKFIVEDMGFMLSKEDTATYNQISGKMITGYVKNNHLYKIDVVGNAQSIYYIKDNLKEVGTNKAESGFLTIYLNKKNKVEKIVMYPQSSGTMLPPTKKDKNLVTLKNMIDYEDLRPKDKEDIYIKKSKIAFDKKLNPQKKKRKEK